MSNKLLGLLITAFGLFLVWSFFYSTIYLLWSGIETTGKITSAVAQRGLDGPVFYQYNIEFNSSYGKILNEGYSSQSLPYKIGPINLLYDKSNPNKLIIYNLGQSKVSAVLSDSGEGIALLIFGLCLIMVGGMILGLIPYKFLMVKAQNN